jgi:hypothetical protein
VPKRAGTTISERREFLKNPETIAKPQGSRAINRSEKGRVSYVVDAVFDSPTLSTRA